MRRRHLIRLLLLWVATGLVALVLETTLLPELSSMAETRHLYTVALAVLRLANWLAQYAIQFVSWLAQYAIQFVSWYYQQLGAGRPLAWVPLLLVAAGVAIAIVHPLIPETRFSNDSTLSGEDGEAAHPLSNNPSNEQEEEEEDNVNKIKDILPFTSNENIPNSIKKEFLNC